MGPFNFLRLFLFYILLMMGHANLFGQCKSTIELVKTRNAGEGRNDGEITTKVNAEGPYKIELVQINRGVKKVIKAEEGNGTKIFNFTNLEGSGIYLIDVVFVNEEKFLCKSSTIRNIHLSERP